MLKLADVARDFETTPASPPHDAPPDSGSESLPMTSTELPIFSLESLITDAAPQCDPQDCVSVIACGEAQAMHVEYLRAPAIRSVPANEHTAGEPIRSSRHTPCAEANSEPAPTAAHEIPALLDVPAAAVVAASEPVEAVGSATAHEPAPTPESAPAIPAPEAIAHAEPACPPAEAVAQPPQTSAPVAASEPLAASHAAPAPVEISHADKHTANERLPLSAFVREVVPEDEFRPHLEVEHFLWPSAVRAILERGGPDTASFATQLLARAQAGEKVLAITGGGRGEGRTSVALGLARTIAAAGGRVVLVDADFERPDLARSLGVAPEFGWDHVLQGELPLDDVLITSLGDHLAMVPWHQRLAGSVLPFHPLRANVSLGLLREHYDLVLVDGGPLAGGQRPAGLASLVHAARFDGCYLIHDCRPQAASSLAAAVRAARSAGLRVCGAIENFSLPTQGRESPQRLAA